MSQYRSEPADRKRRRQEKPEARGSKLVVTHCVVCEFESSHDFDACPRCKAERMSVLVLKRS